MARMTRLTVVLIATMAVLARPTLASDPVPFRGTMVGLTTSAELVDPSHVLTFVSLSGQATQLGSYTGTGTVEVDLSNLTTVGHWVLTAANGDTLFVTMTGQATPTLTPGVLYIAEHRTVVGGTGRFEGASGEADASGQTDVNTGIAVTSWDGTLTSVGSGKHP